MAAPKSIQTIHPQAFDLTTANTARDGTGTWVDAFTGVASPGSVLQKISVTAIGATTKGNIKVAIYDGVANQYIGEVPVPPTDAPSANQTPWRWPDLIPFVGDGREIELPSATWKVRCAPHATENFNGFSRGGDFV